MSFTKLSFEFFPPRTEEGRRKLAVTRKQLSQYQPEYFSCTYGAGGTTRSGTLQTITDIMNDGVAAAPHLACIGASREEMISLLQTYKNMGIRHIVALRGDVPSGVGFGHQGLRYANELVTLIRQEFDDWFHIEIAAYPEFHPQSRSAEDDINHFVRKCQAGADSAITQYFFNADSYFWFVDEVQSKGIDIPIIPGIMPIASFSKLARFSETCGAEIPRWLRLKLQSYADDTASIKALGLDVVTEMCDHLLQQGAPSLHFYTLNQAGLVSTICQRLGY
ncbi:MULTISPECIES: methylenetetrahydrofolate reductase [NAD(P)H] [Snodgrassella]|uniref:methylenetetrahydrofolate reductase [NAD(P)H] n=1 Tax=Snodgrassella TaxID=1193515 RepID=UPI0004D34B25|nr:MULTISPECIES: methylenetetrahydrofolate reductase [NAD(P)H] [Snodgrassella]KES10716.1 5,10-methylenetetrahydrofolate reductase [Snodgrassella alvi SCGC AB-598-O11]MBI0068903.1 methylenetetrahydrofolate reductase [NAD(P)H] [Snodgrassella sp. M0110]MBI0077904.1 methylenetetrahydrofolate reductase [NAD(P)H] [Snodgrassella sp. M0118]MBI0080203.1 methylenetetrahydrofolate reductase [NAD(P)H] [Snodgrassella sp. M0112]NUF77596.1 methylenetetrahydrofolate reductase [NAD(P)H] [Snodgrassella sp. ESL0